MSSPTNGTNGTDFSIGSKCLLVALSLKVWNAERESRECAQAIADKYGSDPRMGKYRRYLIDPDALKPLLKLRGAIRNRHYEISLPWGDDGARIITVAGFYGYRGEMDQFRAKWEPMVSQFVSDYPALRASARSLLNGLYSDADYPEDSAIAGKFGLDVRFAPVPESNDFRATLSDQDVQAIRAQIDADKASAIQHATQEIADRIRAGVGHMAERLNAYGRDEQPRACGVCSGAGKFASGHRCGTCVGTGKVQVTQTTAPFRDSLVENIRQMVRDLPGLNLTDDARITAVLAQVSRLGVHDADVLRESDVTRESTAKLAENILAKMQEYGL